MLVTAFSTKTTLASTRTEKWEEAAADMYSDASDLISLGVVSASCLAKAVLTCSVFDTRLGVDEKIPSEDVTWDSLRWRSIVFAASPQSTSSDKSELLRRKGTRGLTTATLVGGSGPNDHG